MKRLLMASGLSVVLTVMTGTAWAFQDDVHSCDPMTVMAVIPVKTMKRVEVRRTNDSFWVEFDPEVDTQAVDPKYVADNGRVWASSLKFAIDGHECPALIDSVQMSTSRGWEALRLSGSDEYGSNYFGQYFTVGKLRVGLSLMLLQKAYCDITVNALFYAPDPAYGRPVNPNPRC